MCRTLGVSASGYYASLERPLSARALEDETLLQRIRKIHLHSRGTYGAPRIHAELRDEGIRVGRKRVARLMAAASSVIHHSDQGCQYTSLAFGKRCRLAGVRPSMGSVGDCYDNAMCESFFATLECEVLDFRPFHSQAEARMALFDFIEGWYNPQRRHSALGYHSPLSFERLYAPVPNQ